MRYGWSRCLRGIRRSAGHSAVHTVRVATRMVPEGMAAGRSRAGNPRFPEPNGVNGLTGCDRQRAVSKYERHESSREWRVEHLSNAQPTQPTVSVN
jgi:hypothetical protein